MPHNDDTAAPEMFACPNFSATFMSKHKSDVELMLTAFATQAITSYKPILHRTLTTEVRSRMRNNSIVCVTIDQLNTSWKRLPKGDTAMMGGLNINTLLGHVKGKYNPGDCNDNFERFLSFYNFHRLVINGTV